MPLLIRDNTLPYYCCGINRGESQAHISCRKVKSYQTKNVKDDIRKNKTKKEEVCSTACVVPHGVSTTSEFN